ncbi:nucleotidyltransferase domain-containing protein [Pseudactinotalea suaedae]|uniref:nucleotidyltransferase domain-containing protein n=1 Tax=Pseudactinotalea suaedae TaxID=1524924 RepID=UPI0012E18E69|nr:nucleotidyltransferase domain-containing protein [Pseudactinotalea suaedae]
MEPQRPLAVATSTLDGDVLARLATIDAAVTASQLTSALSRGSLEGVRRALARLVKQGVVTAAAVGARGQQYRFNNDHVAAPAIVALARLTEEVQRRFQDLLRQWEAPPVYAALFGSWATTSASADSDLDVFLVRPREVDASVWEGQVIQLQRVATSWTGNDTRAFVLDDDEIESAAVAADPALAQILREGIALHGDPDAFRRRVTRAQRGKA